MKHLVAAFAIAALCGSTLAQTTDKQPAPADKKPVPATPTAPSKDKPKEPKKDAAVTLKVGDAAPALTCDSWIKGEAVTSFEKGKVYVVEFWATWCGPCLTSIPHLTELQKEHKELTIIGMASSEREPKSGETDKRLDKLNEFVKGQADKMAYRVAYDSKRAMSKTWMQPAGQNGIPCAFVVNGEGKIAYIGHPMKEEFEQAISTALGKKHEGKEKKKG